MARNYFTDWSTADWVTLTCDSWQLWADSVAVMSMRTSDMLTGRPGAEHEAVRMVTEKLSASAELLFSLAVAGQIAPDQAAHKAVRHYAGKVRANRKRLTRQRS